MGYENKLTRHFADCRALDLSNPTIATSRLDEDERAKFNLGRQEGLFEVKDYYTRSDFVKPQVFFTPQGKQFFHKKLVEKGLIGAPMVCA